MAFPSPPLSFPVQSHPPFDGPGGGAVSFDFAPPPSYPSFDGVDLGIFDYAQPPSYPFFDAGTSDFALPQSLDAGSFDFAPQPPYQSLEGVDAGTLSVPPPQSYSFDAGTSLSVENDGFSLLDIGGVNMETFLDGGKRPTRLPPGFSFRPTDEELITYYLQLEFLDASSAPKEFITHADIYDYEPHQLSDGKMGRWEDHGDGKMYFYTRIKKIGKSKTDRSIKSKKGNWKATQAPKPIRDSTGKTIGNKASLAYFEDKKKTQWLMQEYKLESHTSHHSSQELVLAVIYYHRRGRRDDGGGDH